MSLRLELRPASMADSELLYGWRTDPVTEANSLSQGPKDLDEHRVWLRRVLADPSTLLYVAEIAGVPVGTGRVTVDRAEQSAELSLTVAPERRGGGVGGQIIQALVHECGHLPVKRLHAKVMGHNTASLRAFMGNSFTSPLRVVTLERVLA